MIIALLLAAAAPAADAGPSPRPMSAIDAERAFAADAQKNGQWTAFRQYAAPDAVMFVPEKVNAQAWLKDRVDPPTRVYWWPGRSYVSCDGTVAVNTGPWVRGYGKSVGYFTTIWMRQADGSWKWIYDAGDPEKFARGEGGDISPFIASCKGKPSGVIQAKSQHSKDQSLAWLINLGPRGQRRLRVYQWNGARYQMVIEDKVAAAK